MKNTILLSLLLSVAACASVPPAVSAFNGDSVEITVSAVDAQRIMRGASDPETIAEATRICGKVSKKAEYASTRSVAIPGAWGAKDQVHLFLCL